METTGTNAVDSDESDSWETFFGESLVFQFSPIHGLLSFPASASGRKGSREFVPRVSGMAQRAATRLTVDRLRLDLFSTVSLEPWELLCFASRDVGIIS